MPPSHRSPLPISQPGLSAPPGAPPQTAADLSEAEKEALEEPVTLVSSMLTGAYYEPESETVTVIFNNADEGSYPCTIQQYQQLVSSVSPGKFMWENFL